MRTTLALEIPVKVQVQIPQGLIDYFGELSKLRVEFAPTERLYQKLHAELKALVADSDPDQTFAQSGERFSLDVSACRMERKIDVKAAHKKLGWTSFLKVCSVTMKSLEGFLVKPEIEALTVSSQTGARTFTAIPLDPA